MSKKVKVLTTEQIDFIADLLIDQFGLTPKGEQDEELLSIFQTALVVTVECSGNPYFSK